MADTTSSFHIRDSILPRVRAELHDCEDKDDDKQNDANGTTISNVIAVESHHIEVRDQDVGCVIGPPPVMRYTVSNKRNAEITPRRTTTDAIGRMMGRTIRHKTVFCVAPSTIAASQTSGGTCCNALRNSSILKPMRQTYVTMTDGRRGWDC
jgi:hypothetical protein